ncbi:estrogen receptor-like receptor [Apostichopus japonicus]|uniref:Estrogen receptor-like receptor n=1 Tax=Stichopus japonicus TaxID=307972 RepID=A0A2G8LES0_STIJA|nr:estrogen receptor-like receptor [Apostichopus japonicus]
MTSLEEGDSRSEFNPMEELSVASGLQEQILKQEIIRDQPFFLHRERDSDTIGSVSDGGHMLLSDLRSSGFHSRLYGRRSVPGAVEDNDKPSNPRLCAVCEDLASGYHYGIASCEACKAFFKRTYKSLSHTSVPSGNLKYLCHAKNRCEVTKKRRKACPGCRFKKCMDMGMMLDGVRPDRVRGADRNTGEDRRDRLCTIFICQKSKVSERLSRSLCVCQQPSIKVSSQECNICEETALELMKLLLKIEPPVSDMSPLDPSLRDRDMEFRTMKIITDLGDKALVNVVHWAKQVPGVTELSLNDQMILLQEGWMEILLWQVLFRSLSLTNPDRIFFTNGLSMDTEQAERTGLGPLFNRGLHIVKKMREVGIDKEEYTLLKAVVLTNVGQFTFFF